MPRDGGAVMPQSSSPPAPLPNDTPVICARIGGERRPGDDWTSPRAVASYEGADVSDATARPDPDEGEHG